MPVVKAHLRNHVGSGKDALLFPAAADSNAHLAPSTLYKVRYPARAAAGRPDLRWHDLRYTGAVLAAQTGATRAELMGRLGHSAPGAAMVTSTPRPTGTPRSQCGSRRWWNQSRTSATAGSGRCPATRPDRWRRRSRSGRR